MASIHSDEEHQFMVELHGGFPWLGGQRDPGNHSNWVWSDGTPWDYSNWALGEPNDFGGEDCVEFGNRALGERDLWNDKSCSVVRTFVCKK